MPSMTVVHVELRIYIDGDFYVLQSMQFRKFNYNLKGRLQTPWSPGFFVKHGILPTKDHMLAPFSK